MDNHYQTTPKPKAPSFLGALPSAQEPHQEEIDFKPLTTGLGFHRRGTASGPLPSHQEKSSSLLRPSTTAPQTLRPPSLPALRQRYFNSSASPELNRENREEAEQQSKNPSILTAQELKEARASWPMVMVSYLIDVLIIASGTLILSYALLVLNETNFDNTWEYLTIDYASYLYAPVLLFTYFFYFVLFQTLLGQTPGQWCCRLRIVRLYAQGSSQQIAQAGLFGLSVLTLTHGLSIATLGLSTLILKPQNWFGFAVLKT